MKFIKELHSAYARTMNAMALSSLYFYSQSRVDVTPNGRDIFFFAFFPRYFQSGAVISQNGSH